MTTNSMGAADASLLKEVSLTDPQAAWAARKNNRSFFRFYDANYLIDNKAGIIVDAGLSRQPDRWRSPLQGPCWTGSKRFHLRPQRAMFTVYGAVRLPQVAGRSQADNPAHPGVGQVDAFWMAPSAALTPCLRSRAQRLTSVRVESCCIPPEQSSDGGGFAIVPQRSIASVCKAFKMRCCPSTPM